MGNNLTIEPRVVPLTQVEGGTWRVTGTRIPLERIVECYEAGATPEQIVEAFDTLRLADVYLVIAYYLEHRDDVQAYLQAQDEKAEEIRRMIEAHQPPRPGFKEELLRRRAQLEGKNGAPGQ